MAAESADIEVVYAGTDRQLLVSLTVTADTTVIEAVRLSGILAQFPEIDPARQKFGIYGCICSPEKTVGNGDRIEIYRTLRQSPMEARRSRVRQP